MAYALNNIRLSRLAPLPPPNDDVVVEATLECPNSVRVNLDVTNASILYQVSVAQGVNPGGEYFGQEVFMPPGWRSIERWTHKVRVIAATDQIANVTVEAVNRYEIDGSSGIFPASMTRANIYGTD